ncbi:MAG: ABA4-like family protein [Rhodomicrobiaceae bacterium]
MNVKGSSMNPDTIFQIANAIALAGWLVLLASPFIPTISDRISGFAIPLLLSIAYAGLIVTYFDQSDGGFDTLENVTKLFAKPEAVLAGWIHYLAFDLFVGSWEVRTARKENIPFLAVIPCLVLTFLLGPAGFLAFIALRGARAATSRPA